METDGKIKHDIECKNIKYEYKTNEKMLIGLLKNKLILMLLCPDPLQRSHMFEYILQEASRYKTQIRPNRHFDRPKDSHHRRKLRRKNVL